MSKFDAWAKEYFGEGLFPPDGFKDAWNARGKVDAEICNKQRADTDDEDATGWNTACTECAEAIEQENEK